MRFMGFTCLLLACANVVVASPEHVELDRLRLLRVVASAEVSPAPSPGFGAFVAGDSARRVAVTFQGLGHFTDATAVELALGVALAGDPGDARLECSLAIHRVELTDGQLRWGDAAVVFRDVPWACAADLSVLAGERGGHDRLRAVACVRNVDGTERTGSATLDLTETPPHITTEVGPSDCQSAPETILVAGVTGEIEDALLVKQEDAPKALADRDLMLGIASLPASARLVASWDEATGRRAFTSSDREATQALTSWLTEQGIAFETAGSSAFQASHAGDEVAISFGAYQERILVGSAARAAAGGPTSSH